MATKRPNTRVLQPSLIDRLIDREPENRKESQDARNQSLKELKDSVRRDLEWLLNSRRCPVTVPTSAKELSRSVYCYGLPDITGVGMSSSQQRAELKRMVEAVVAAYEPRLISVTVSMNPIDDNHHLLRFQIEGLLRTEPAPARVFFDTTLELTKGEYQVAGEDRAR